MAKIQVTVPYIFTVHLWGQRAAAASTRRWCRWHMGRMTATWRPIYSQHDAPDDGSRERHWRVKLHGPHDGPFTTCITLPYDRPYRGCTTRATWQAIQGQHNKGHGPKRAYIISITWQVMHGLHNTTGLAQNVLYGHTTGNTGPAQYGPHDRPY